MLAYAGAMWVLSTILLNAKPEIALWIAYVAPVTLLVAVFLAINLARSGPTALPLSIFFCGVGFILGGAFLDIGITLMRTPDLSLEQNPVVRLLLDNGHTISFVYVYGAVAQTCYLAFLTMLWAALLRHRQLIIASVKGAIYNANGELCGLGLSYHLLWLLVVLILACAFDRW